MQINLCVKVAWTKRFFTPQLIKVMKLTVFLIFLACLQVSAKVFSQITLSKKNVPLTEVISTIQQQSGYSFFYKHKLVENINISADLHNVTLQQALDKILDGQPLTYEVIDKTVVIKEKETSFLDKLKNSIKAELAQVTISGKVIDETGQPMQGVTVREKGTNNVIATGTDGKFTLTVSSNDALVDFTYIGYEPKEVSAKELPKGVVLTLSASATNLREVTINKGYYTEKQALSTGDVSVVSAKEIEGQPVTDPILALEGRVPGLLITQTSGLPGAYSTVRLRGMNSIANGNDPLYIIDGVPFSSISLTINAGQVGGGSVGTPSANNFSNGKGLSPFNMLNPEDIEDIEVLKDADATAIYGAKGANGVILITTKKGKSGAVKVNLQLSQGAGKVTRMMSMMNTQQYLQMERQAYANDGLTFPSITANPQDGNYSINGLWDTTRTTNWQKILLGNTAHYTNAQLSLSGGTESTSFYVGGGFSRQTTVFPGNEDDGKASINFNVNHSSLDQRFKFQLTGGYTYDDNLLPLADLTTTALQLPPDAPALYHPDGSLNWQLYNGTSTFGNPLNYLLKTAEAKSNLLTGNALLSYQLLPGLKIQSSFGYTDGRLNQSNQTPSTAIAPPKNLITTNRINNFGNSEIANWIIEPMLSYDHNIAKGKLNITFGSTLEQQTINETAFTSSGYNGDALIPNPLNASTFKLASVTNTLYRYQAIYARVGYTWQDKYLLNLTANRDGSSRFGPSNEWGNFGAIGVGWVFSKEKFAENNLPWLSFGKLRGSYGITGNDQIADYQYLSSYTTDATTYQNSTGLVAARLPNPYYGWEVDKKLEGGIELGLLKDRINLSVSYYQNRTGNQLVGYPLPNIAGFTSIQYNLPAVVQNTGTEIVLNTVNIVSSSFRWTSIINLSFQNNKLVSYPGIATSSFKNIYTVGQSLFTTQKFLGTKVNPADGTYEWLSANGSYTENPSYPADLRVSAALTPKYYGSFGNSFTYKGFQLDVFLEFRKQVGLNFLSTEVGPPGLVGINQPTAIIGNTWTTVGQEAKYGKLSTQFAADPNFWTNSSDWVLSDASFVRLKNIALSWTLPKSWQQKVQLTNTRIFLQAQNLLTFTHYFGLDPETGSGALPPLQMITVGLRTSF